MTPPSFSDIVRNLPAMTPFVGPEAIERQKGRVFNVRIGANESAFGISPRARAAMIAATEQTAWYGDPENHDLRAALAAHHGVTINHIVVAAGIDDLLGLIVRMFLNPGDVVVASHGSYPTFAYHIAGYGARMETVPYRDDKNDPEALIDAAAKHRAKLVFFANPDNPTGTYHGKDAVRYMLDHLPSNCLFLLDEAYVDFVPPDTILPINCDDPRIVRTRTFSKAHGMAGARVGYAIAHTGLIDAFNKVRLHFGVTRISQEGALASLQDQDFIRGVVRAVEEGKQAYYALARELGVSTIPSHTNFVAFDFGTAERAIRTMNRLIDRGVFVRMPGVAPLNRLVRVTVGTPEDRAAFAEVLREVING